MTQYGPMVTHEVTATFGQTRCQRTDRPKVSRKATRKMMRGA